MMRINYILEHSLYIFHSSSVRTLGPKRIDYHIKELTKHAWFFCQSFR